MNWYTKQYRRHLCDMHIEDWNDAFLRDFSPEEYVKNLKLAHINTPMFYFQSHVGYCYWPTKTAHMHNAFAKEPDKMKRLVELCHKENMKVVGYYSLDYNNWAHDTHPEWRMLDIDGASRRQKGERYGLCCPNNSEYRQFVFAQIQEMADYFTVDGMFYDMPFWPQVCYCPSCRKRWSEEVGGELPTDKTDPRWDVFMTKRQQWLGEFSQAVTDETKRLMPHVSVEQNFASAVADRNGNCCVSNSINDACDYAGGDLYGGFEEQSFACKYYSSVTHNPPFEYMTCRVKGSLARHTLTKSMDELRLAVFLTVAHHGATLMIDAIDPVGTMDERFYRQLGMLYAEEEAYEPYLEGELHADLGIFFSLKSKFNMQGQNFSNMSGALNAFKTAVRFHLPSSVITEYQQNSLADYPVIIAANLNHADKAMEESLVSYVEQGGILYFSNADQPELLRRLTGGVYRGHTPETVVYMAPKEEHEALFEGFNAKYPLNFGYSVPVVEGIPEQYVLATLTKPYTLQTGGKFASIHSNPPGIATEIPAVVMLPYGKGRVIWSAVPIEEEAIINYRKILKNLLEYAGYRPTVKTDAPSKVELITFSLANNAGYRMSAVYLSEEEEAVTLPGFTVQLQCASAVKKIVLLPSGEEIPFTQTDGWVSFRTRELHIFDMYEIIC